LSVAFAWRALRRSRAAAQPSLNKPLVLELARCEWIEKRQNCIALGPSGTGKTHVALALGLAACQKGYSVAFTTAAALVHELMEARDERRLRALQKHLNTVKLLFVDELGYVPFTAVGSELLFEVFSQRYERGATLVTSNLPFDEWTSVFGSERLTGALLDRLTHHVHILEMNGESFRLATSKKAQRRTGHAATLWTLLQAGDQVVIDHTLYGNSFVLFVRGLTRFGVKVTVADFTDLDAVATAIAQSAPKLIFFESPGNPNLRIIDIAEVGRMAHEAGALLIVDNTFATPALQQPILLGADLVVHSATKFIGGHGDLIAGVAAGPKDIVDSIRRHGLRYLTGATIAPITAFLLLRGLKTLELRMERHCSSALAIAQLLEQHPAVAWVSYPGLAHSPFHQLARRQMTAFGGLVACELWVARKRAWPS
jgi:cystathionine beta-lyase/cystathionine gamma-synthase